MRFWENFKDPRTAAALTSALFALVFAILELRALFSGALAGVPSSEPVLASALATGIVSLFGCIIALRRGNLVFLLVAWAFVLGSKFAPFVRLLDELSASAGRATMVLAVLSANLDLLLALIGAALAFASAFLRRKPRKSPR